MTWKVGVVGCGRIAGGRDAPRPDGPVTTHAQAYARHPAFELVAVMHPTPVTVQAFQRTWGIPQGYRTLADMLQHESLDVISLCSPTEWHAPQALEIMASSRRPRVLFMEKPVCRHAHELEALSACARQQGTGVLVNHSRRFDPAHRRASALVRSGALGALVSGRCLYYGGWLNNGTHVVDTLRLLFPGPIQVVSAAMSGHGRGDDRNVTAELCVGGASVAVEAFDESRYQLFESDFRFESGRLRLQMDGQIIVERVERNRLDERVLAPAEGFPLQGLDSPLAHAVAAIDSYLAGRLEWDGLGADLTSASVTMETLWQAHALALGQDPLTLAERHVVHE